MDVLPHGYAEFLDDLKTRIRTAQVRAALAVNRELVALYWEIGRAVVERQEAEGWGRAVIERLGKDLQAAFPGRHVMEHGASVEHAFVQRPLFTDQPLRPGA